MRLKNFLLVVEDIDRSIQFYTELFGLYVVSRFEGNAILTEGLVLQERKNWEALVGKNVEYHSLAFELFFTEKDMNGFLDKLETSRFEIQYVNPVAENSWGRRVVRLYDPDHHVIEVGEDV